MITHLYRIEDRAWAPPVDEFEVPQGRGDIGYGLYALPVLNTTPKGWWIMGRYGRRLVLSTSNKRYACPTIKEAVESYVARKNKEIQLHQNRLAEAQARLKRLRVDIEENTLPDETKLVEQMTYGQFVLVIPAWTLV